MARLDVCISRRRALAYGAATLGAVGTGVLEPRATWARSSAGESAQGSAVNWPAVAKAAGGPGQMMAGGVFLVDLARSDIKATAYGVPVQPDLAMDGEAAFKQFGSTAMAMGELALLQKEVPSVMRGLLANGFSVSALHNHLLEMTPLVVFIHYSGMGDAVSLAHKLRASLAGTGTPNTTTATKKAPAIDVKGVQQALGMAGQIEDQVLAFDVPRAEQIVMTSTPMGTLPLSNPASNAAMGNPAIPPAMGVQSFLYFQAAPGGKAASQAELALLGGEIDPVSRAIEQQGFTIAAIHNHMTTISPMLFWMHVWATGDAVRIAKGWRAVLSHTKSKV